MWPDHQSLEDAMEGMFQRLKEVRDIDKKHVQRRAFIDLLKFMKDQGLRANFLGKTQPFIIEAKLVETGDASLQEKLAKYFYKAHELLLITEAASQVDEGSDLKNADILRIQGFTKSLMHRVLLMNKNLELLRAQRDSFEELAAAQPDFLQSTQPASSSEVALTPSSMAEFARLRDFFLQHLRDVTSRLEIVSVLEKRTVTLQYGGPLKTKESTALSDQSLMEWGEDIEQVLQASEKLAHEHAESRRIASLAQMLSVNLKSL